jgi:hypothetical protein
MRVCIALLLLVGVPLEPAVAQDRVHSDLPLFTHTDDELSPRSFHERNGDELSFGCAHRVTMGDWKYVEPDEVRGQPRIRWMRLHNYGAFHCAAYERWSGERSGLKESDAKPSWFVELGRVSVNGAKLALWAMQTGSRPGSDYLLLSRRNSDGIIKQFNVLPVFCPDRFRRRGKPIDVWRVDYCSVSSQSELRSLAKSMAKHPPVGTLTFVADIPENED